MRGLGDLGGIVISDPGRQRRHQHQRTVQAGLDIVQPRLNPHHAIVGEADCGIGHQTHALQKIIGHHRIIDVQLEMALAVGKGERRIVAEDLHADLGHGFALGGIDLARHDGGAGLIFRQRQFPKAGTRPRTQQSNIVGDLEQAGCHRVDGAMAEHHGVMGRQGLELVGRGGERHAGNGGNARGHHLVETDGSIEAGADGGAALRQLHQFGHGLADALDAVGDLLGIAGKFLAQCDRGGVLGMGAADLDNVFPGRDLDRQRRQQMFQGGQQALFDFLGAGDMHGGGIGVVGRLAHIDVIVGMDGLFGAHNPAQHFDGAV